MTALDELRSGTIGTEFVHLLYRTVAVVSRARNFPPPADHASWTQDAVIETAHDFLVSPRADRRLLELAASSSDDVAFDRLLSATVLNHLRSQGRRTTIGKLVRRLKGLIDEDPRFTTVGPGMPGAGNVALAIADSPHPYGGPPDILRRAAIRESDVRLVRWSPTARREGPFADGPSLLRVCEAVLEAAEGSLRLPDLAEVVTFRFGLDPRQVPVAMPVDEMDNLIPAVLGDESAEAGLADMETAAILDQFSDRELLVLAWLHETVRTIADRTGLAVSSAGAAKQRVAAKLRVLLANESTEHADEMAIRARDAARRRLHLDQV